MTDENNPGEWLFHDRYGHPITPPEWERLGECTYRQIARTSLTDTAAPGDEWTVSTLWRQPTSYESVVVRGGRVCACGTYPDEAAARRGHADIVEGLAASMADPLIVHPGPRATPDNRTDEP